MAVSAYSGPEQLYKACENPFCRRTIRVGEMCPCEDLIAVRLREAEAEMRRQRQQDERAAMVNLDQMNEG